MVVILLLFAPVHLYAQQNVNTGRHSVEPDTITIASEPDYPPYCMVDENGHAVGFSLDLFKAAAKAVGLEVNIKIGVWNKIKQDLADGKIDALPLVGRTPEREELFDFTMPYLSLHGAVFVREGTSGINSLADLKTKEIAVMKSDNAEEYVRRDKISNHIFTTNTFEEAFKELAAGKYDAVITQRVMGLELLKKTGIESVKPLDMQLPNFRQDFCFAVQKGNKNLLNRLNEGLSIIIANKTYEEIRLKWFGPAIKGRIATKDILKIILYTIIPMFFIISGISIIVLRKEVKRQTKDLINKIAEKKKVEKELRENEAQLRSMSGKLEDQVVERTTELQDKVKKLDKSQQAMLYMVEDLNRITTELKEERHKLGLSNKHMEAFTYSISHDLKAPLRAVDGYTKILIEDYGPLLDNEGRRVCDVISAGTRKMGRLIDDLLAFSRIGRVEMRHATVDMEAMAKDVFFELTTPEERERIDFHAVSLPLAQGDPMLLRQVWANLIGNAVKFSARKERALIEVGCVAEGGKPAAAKDSEMDVLTISPPSATRTTASETVYFVRDNGAGFDMTYSGKLFGVFQRLHSEKEFDGTGVGLSIVQSIIQRHGGRIWAEGEVGKGATFYFILGEA